MGLISVNKSNIWLTTLNKLINVNRAYLLRSILIGSALVAVFGAILLAPQWLSVSRDQDDVLNGLGNHCGFVNLVCRLTLDGQTVEAEFDALPEIEEPVTLTIRLPTGAVFERAWIEGVNMFMGKIPLILESQSAQTVSGWFMLGACSEDLMQWQLVVYFKGQPEPALMTFSTFRR